MNPVASQTRLPRIAVFGVGHHTYWGQFDGLLGRLMGFHKKLLDMIRAEGVEPDDYGMADDARSGHLIAEKMRDKTPDLIICNMLTYAPSCTFAPILREFKAPLILAALQPLAAMDYARGSTVIQLENDNVCSVPEFTSVAMRYGRPVTDVIIGTLENDPRAKKDLGEWVRIAKVLRSLRGARLGHMGHVLEAMYDMHVDDTSMAATFGIHAPQLEPEDLMRHWKVVTDSETKEREKLILETFDTPDPKSDPDTRKLTAEDLNMAARTFAAMERLIAEKDLTGMAYYYEGEADSLQRKVMSSLIVGNSILQARGFPICGEHDLKTCAAMLMMDRLGIGGSFAEFHPLDFKEDFILVGHDGPHHIAVAEGKPVIRSLTQYHGKPGSGASVEFQLKSGPITMLGITTMASGKYKFVIGEGESKKGPIPPTGNTNTRGYFGPDIRSYIKRWVMEGPTHHYALGVGHHAGTFQKIAKILGIESVVVGPNP